uniref:Uncharacterized protein n=1 Tax=Ascaris lumbricoides TaxID=6252 RepID=A0A9J2Q646_ASCLU
MPTPATVARIVPLASTIVFQEYFGVFRDCLRLDVKRVGESMAFSTALHTITVLLLALLILFLCVLLLLLCIHICRHRRLSWDCSSMASAKLAANQWGVAFDEPIGQVDIDRIVSRREERLAEKEANLDSLSEINSKPLERIDNETATVLAVDQLLDTSFLITDEELACYVPQLDLKVIASRRDQV